MAKVYINPGHDTKYDSGAVNPINGMREADVVKEVGELVVDYLSAVGYQVLSRQSDNLYYDTPYADRDVSVVDEANSWGADVFVSIHCNAANQIAKGTEVEVYRYGSKANDLADCIQAQIVTSLDTVDRGVKERPNLLVLKHTDMPSVLVELAFIDSDSDADLLKNNRDDFARAVARGITDYFAKH